MDLNKPIFVCNVNTEGMPMARANEILMASNKLVSEGTGLQILFLPNKISSIECIWKGIYENKGDIGLNIQEITKILAKSEQDSIILQ